MCDCECKAERIHTFILVGWRSLTPDDPRCKASQLLDFRDDRIYLFGSK